MLLNIYNDRFFLCNCWTGINRFGMRFIKKFKFTWDIHRLKISVNSYYDVLALLKGE